jgi:hypothetical protein
VRSLSSVEVRTDAAHSFADGAGLLRHQDGATGGADAEADGCAVNNARGKARQLARKTRGRSTESLKRALAAVGDLDMTVGNTLVNDVR